VYIFLSSFSFAQQEESKEKAMTHKQAQINQELCPNPF